MWPSRNSSKQLGFPGELVENWEQVALDKMRELTGKYRSLQVFLDSCVKCGACTDKCHYFLGTSDPKNMPVARQDLLRKVYRRYFTFAGKYFPKLVGAVDLTKDVLDDWYSYFHQCSQCRRCSVFCPYGIDTAEISMAAREIMDNVGMGQKYCNEIIGKVFKIGNNLGLPQPALKRHAGRPRGRSRGGHRRQGALPAGRKGRRHPAGHPVRGLLRRTACRRPDRLWQGLPRGRHQLDDEFPCQSKPPISACSSAATKTCATCPCASAKRRSTSASSASSSANAATPGASPTASSTRWPDRSISSIRDTRAAAHLRVHHDLIQRGTLTLDKSENDDMVLTYHDSCNVARASRMGRKPGGQFIIPRDVIKASCNHFYDMPQDTIHESTFCCGGGGGLLTDDLMELRVKGALPRMEALKQVVEEHGVTHMAAICAICKSQFTKVLPYYGFTMDRS